ncbi:MAG: energy transducer TonB [Treponema sp.]|nr:energy transducer TonB [Treponema sp.]
MSRSVAIPQSLVRPLIFAGIALLHGALLFFVAFSVKTAPLAVPEPMATVMKLMDFDEYTPLPPPPPPPERPPDPVTNTVEAIAETMIETDEIPPDVVVSDVYVPQMAESVYLPMHKISVPPKFSERDIMSALIYPPIALRSGIEGMVYLELFVDNTGLVRKVTMLKEDPPNRGFGEAAVKAFENRRGEAAQANGEAVAARYRYPVRFSIKN